MNEVKVSVIVAIYNSSKYLYQCLESIKNQTLREIEVICVDDGSTDSSFEIIEEFTKKDKRFIAIKQKNASAGAARNNGLRISKGKYVSFLDSDDFFDEHMLEEAYEKAEQTDAQIVVFKSDKYLENKKIFKSADSTLKYDSLPDKDPFDRTELKESCFQVFMGCAWDKIFNRRWIIENNIWFQEQRTTNDMYFVYVSIAIADKITCVEKGKVLAHQRRGDKSSLSNTREKSWDCFYKALIALRKRLYDEGIYKELEREYINYALDFSIWNLNTLKSPINKMLLKKLKEEWWKELGIINKEKEFFFDYNIEKFYQLKVLMQNNYLIKYMYVIYLYIEKLKRIKRKIFNRIRGKFFE